MGPKGGYAVENAPYNQVTSLVQPFRWVATINRFHCSIIAKVTVQTQYTGSDSRPGLGVIPDLALIILVALLN